MMRTGAPLPLAPRWADAAAFRARPRFAPAAAFLGLHVLLGAALYANESLVILHVAVSALGALGIALVARSDRMVLAAAGYLVGSETLWRMTQAPIPWESGKFIVILVLLVRMARVRARFVVAQPAIFLLLLLPSVWISAETLAGSELRGQISFNLSGVVCLAVAWTYLSQVRLDASGTRATFIAIIGPTVAMSFYAMLGLMGETNIKFAIASNFAASAGFGPNQVSIMLGLAALCCLLLLQLGRGIWVEQATWVALAIGLLAHAALTFSRGGVISAVAAALVGGLFAFVRRETMGRAFLVTAVLLLAVVFVVLPQLESFTGGAIVERFSSLETTGRDRLVEDDLLKWSDSPLFGVGVGLSKLNRLAFRRDIAPHTEYTRILAEHGAMGALALLLLFWGAATAITRAGRGWRRAVAASCVSWALLTMAHAAMRLAAPAFILAFAFTMRGRDVERPDR